MCHCPCSLQVLSYKQGLLFKLEAIILFWCLDAQCDCIACILNLFPQAKWSTCALSGSFGKSTVHRISRRNAKRRGLTIVYAFVCGATACRHSPRTACVSGAYKFLCTAILLNEICATPWLAQQIPQPSRRHGM